MQRTGTDGIGVTVVMKRCCAGPIAYWPHSSLWRTSLWCTWNTASSHVNVTRTVACRRRPRTGPTDMAAETPRVASNSYRSCAMGRDAVFRTMAPDESTSPMTSRMPASRSRRWRSDPRR